MDRRKNHRYVEFLRGAASRTQDARPEVAGLGKPESVERASNGLPLLTIGQRQIRIVPTFEPMRPGSQSRRGNAQGVVVKPVLLLPDVEARFVPMLGGKRKVVAHHFHQS